MAALLLFSLYLGGTIAYATWQLARTLAGVGNILQFGSITAWVTKLFTLPPLRWLGLAWSITMLLTTLPQAPELFRLSMAVGLVLLALPCLLVALRAPVRHWRSIEHERRLFMVAVVVMLALLSPPILVLAAATVMTRRLHTLACQPGDGPEELCLAQLVDGMRQLLMVAVGTLRLLAGALHACLQWLVALFLDSPQASGRPLRREIPSLVASLLVSASLAPRAPPAAA